MQRRCCWPPERLSALFLSLSLHLVPERGLFQRVLDPAAQVVLQAEDPQAVGDVLEDRLRERVGALEDHADPPAHGDGVDVPRLEIDVLVEDAALGPKARDDVVHPIQAADERALPAAGGPDDRGHHPPIDHEVHVPDGGCRPVVGRQVLDGEDGLARGRRGRRGSAEL